MKLKNVSASQVDAWDSCPRAWHFGWVMKLKEPPTLAMQRGTHIHSAAEHTIKRAQEVYANGGKPLFNAEILEPLLPNNEWAAYARSMAEYLPLGEEKVLVEQKIVLPTAAGLPDWIGYIDLLDDSRTLSPFLRVTDHKTSSDFRYAKTPEELRENTQLNSYAKYVFDEGHDEELIQVGHLYVKTAVKTVKSPRVLPVYTEVCQEQVEKIWARDLIKVEDMVRAAEIHKTDLLPAKGTTNGQCQKYGGCPHRSRCGISPIKQKGKENDTMSNAFLAALKAKKDAEAPVTNGASTNPDAKKAAVLAAMAKGKAATVKPPTGVLPPDAPSRTTPIKAREATPEPESDEVDHAEPTGASEIGAAAGKPEPKKRGPYKKGATTPTSEGFTLYIDCMPTKSPHEVGPTLFEDWMGQIHLDLAEFAEKQGKPSWWMLSFADQKMSMGAALSAKVSGGGMPSALIVMSSGPSAKDALDILIPNAQHVVRSLR